MKMSNVCTFTPMFEDCNAYGYQCKQYILKFDTLKVNRARYNL